MTACPASASLASVLWRHADAVYWSYEILIAGPHPAQAHLGTSCLQGWVAEVEGHDCVVCPYHGWAFDEDGVLQDVPAAENQKEWPRKQLIKSYPVKEKVLRCAKTVGLCMTLCGQ